MEYNINNENLPKVFYNIKTQLKENINEISKLLKIDHKYSKINVNIEQLKNILDKFKNEQLETNIPQKIKIVYNGNPYITLNLCILAILTKTVILLDCNECMVGINTFLVNIVNVVLNQFKTNKLVYLLEPKESNDENIDKIICIDDINQYNGYLRKNETKARFYSLNYLNFYSDCDELEDLKELVYQYVNDNQISIESYSELDVEEAAQMIQIGIGEKVLLLTNNEKTKDIFKTTITNKKIFTNQNPFNQEIKLINKEIFYI